MPFTLNGIGTSFCGYSAAIRWEKSGLTSQRGDHDAVTCIVIAFLPIIPLKAVHTLGWIGDRCATTPIRMTRQLLLRAFLRPWLMGLLSLSLCAFGMSAIAAFAGAERKTGVWDLLWVSAIISTVGFSLMMWLTRSNRRNRDIRLVLGRHMLGSSDPAMWPPEAVAKLDQTSPFAGKKFTAIDFREILDRGDFVEAMWLARLAAAKGEPWAEQLTDEILNDPRLSTKLDQFRKKPWRRAEFLGTETVRWWPTLGHPDISICIPANSGNHTLRT